jgi:hypothetical protein
LSYDNVMRRALIIVVLALVLPGCKRRPCTGPREARFSLEQCCAATWFTWNGQACAQVSGGPLGCACSCEGDGCEDRFPTKDACEKAYVHCTK